MSRFFKFFQESLTAVFIVSLFILSACTASFNWREIQSEEHGYLALFPAKTSSEQKTIVYKNQSFPMIMQASQAGDALFAVGTIVLDPSFKDSHQLLEWLQNSAAQVIRTASVPVLEKTQTRIALQKNEKVPVTGLQLEGLGPDQKQRIYWVRWVYRIDESGKPRIFQLSAIQTVPSDLSAQQRKVITEEFLIFMNGFHPY